MATLITKNSSTAAAVPGTGDLVQGELAVNVTDKKVYTKDSGGAVVKLVGSLGNQEADSPIFTGPISANGSTGTTGQVLTSQGAGSPAQWSPTPALTLLATLSPGSGATTVAATSLAAYESLLLISDLSLSAPATVSFELSSNNGSTYGSAITLLPSNNPARFQLQLFRTKTTSTSKPYSFITSVSAGIGNYSTTTGIINAIRISITGGPTFSGTGVAYVYGLG